MLMRALFAAACLTAALCAPARARDLTVVSWGGAYQDALRKVYFQPFTEQTGIRITEDTWQGGIGVLRAKAASGDNPWDLVQVESEELLLGCEEGLFEKIDWAAIGGQDHYVSQGVNPCGVGAIQYNFIMAWDKDKLAATPGWAEFWDVARVPGKRGLRKGVKTNLEFALMADGVAPGDVYRLLRTDEGVNRAFLKLDQLKPYIVWWQLSPQAAQLLGSGEVLMTTAVNGRITAVNRSEHRNFGIQWTGSLYTVDSWAIMKGSPNAADALKFLNFFGDPKREAQLTEILPYGGLAKGANDGLPPEVLAASPTDPQHLSVSLQIDDAFWRDNLDKLAKRFDAWIAQ
jgi:putative spermidine/putrescine transport system substrate-binding protein